MNEKDILKALECCIKDDYDKGCAECPVRCFKGCDFHLAKFALDLIKRQQAEIEKLKKIQQRQVENERLKEAVRECRKHIVENILPDIKPTRCIDPVIKFCQECPWGWCEYPDWVETSEDLCGCTFESGCTLGFDKGRPEDEPTVKEIEEFERWYNNAEFTSC